MIKFLRFAVACALLVPLVAGCNPGDARGPDRTEAHLGEAKLREFTRFFPPAPEGFTRAEEPGLYSAADGSTISYTYRGGQKAFIVVIGFSNKRTGEMQQMLDDEAVRTAWGFDLTAVAGRRALSSKTRGPARNDFIVVVSNSRSVTTAPASSDLPDKALMERVFARVDFKGIANKN